MKPKISLVTKTEEIFSLSAPYNNPYQGTDPKMLFVCSAGLLRSATAANYFARKGWNTRGCGSSDYALIPLSVNLIYWADKIYFMGKENYTQALATFKGQTDTLSLLKAKAIVLDIPDNYNYNNKKLIDMLREQIEVE